MENRPTEPGDWWWEDTYEDLHVAEFDQDMEAMYYDWDGCDFLTVDEFEDLSHFKCWIGNVIPQRGQNEK